MCKERIETLKLEIIERENEIKKLTQKLLNETTDLQQRFRIWVNNGLEKNCGSYIPDPESNLGKWLEENKDLSGRRGVFHFLDYDDSFGLFCLDEDDSDYDVYQINKLKNDPIFMDAVEEMIELNIDSFEIDW